MCCPVGYQPRDRTWSGFVYQPCSSVAQPWQGKSTVILRNTWNYGTHGRPDMPALGALTITGTQIKQGPPVRQDCTPQDRLNPTPSLPAQAQPKALVWLCRRHCVLGPETWPNVQCEALPARPQTCLRCPSEPWDATSPRLLGTWWQPSETYAAKPQALADLLKLSTVQHGRQMLLLRPLQVPGLHPTPQELPVPCSAKQRSTWLHPLGRRAWQGLAGVTPDDF